MTKKILLIDYYTNVKDLRNSSDWINDKIDKLDFKSALINEIALLIYFGMI